jgi:hypothetical protein
MTSTDSGGFGFLSHHRTGLIALPGVAASGNVSASATLSDGSTTTPVTLAVAGAGDIQNIDPAQVTRQYPRPGATDAESEFFPLVEFASPDLPWLVATPTVAEGPLPWLCLVAVQVQDGVSITLSGPGLPDVLHIEGGARASEELPDPATSPLWAHAFAATSVRTASADPVQIGATPPPEGCRLLAPRHLVPNTSYIACLVPTLKASALAGLGHPQADITAALNAPQPNFAWSTSDAAVELPAYLHWEFSCGPAGDFESLARSLHEVVVDASFGSRPLDLGLAGPGMPVTSTSAPLFRGALTAPGIAPAPPWPDPADADQAKVDAALVAEIGAAAKLTAAAKTSAGAGGRPAVGPLLYARAAAGRDDVTGASPAVDWFDQLGRDPRARAVGGLGTRILRRNVEDVMARAWDQVGDVEKANAALRRLQASRAVSASLHARHLTALSPGRLLSVARPVLGRVAVPPSVTAGVATSDALAAVAASALPAGSTWRGLSALLRSGTRLGDAAAAAADAPGRVVSGLANGITEPSFVPDGTLSLAPPSAVLGAAAPAALTAAVRSAAVAAGLTAPAEGAAAADAARGLDSLTAAAGQQSATAASRLAGLTGTVVRAHATPSNVVFSQVGGVLMSEADLHAGSLQQGVDVHPAVVASTVAVTAATGPATAATGPATAATAPTAATGAAIDAAGARTLLATAPRPVSGTLVAAATAALSARPVAPIGPLTQARPSPVGPTVLAAPIQPAPVGPAVPVGPVQLAPVAPVISVTPALPIVPVGSSKPVVVSVTGTDPRLSVMRDAFATAVDRFVRPGGATALPPAGAFGLPDARTALLANLDPVSTVAALAHARIPALDGLTRPDPVAPVMAGPVFSDPAYAALAAASHDAFVPGLNSIPVDSITLLQSNPTFIAAYLAGLNSALGHELLWRGYPTDERGTYWYSFWGAGPDIGPLHQFTGPLSANVLEGAQPLLVLVLRGRLLKRYPDADIYAVLASGTADLPELDSGGSITRPLFRDFVEPDITLVGFHLTFEQVVGTGAAQGYWFVLAEHPGQPRFGLTDPDPAAPHPPLPSWDELSWADLGSSAAGAVYVPAAPPPMAPAGTTRHWGSSAADMAAITYQPAVRVAIRARDLLGTSHS